MALMDLLLGFGSIIGIGTISRAEIGDLAIGVAHTVRLDWPLFVSDNYYSLAILSH